MQTSNTTTDAGQSRHAQPVTAGLPALVALIDGVNSGDRIGIDAEHPAGGRLGFHIIAAHDGIVPVAEVYSYGSDGSADDGPILEISEAQALEYARLFAAAPKMREALKDLCDMADATRRRLVGGEVDASRSITAKARELLTSTEI